MSEELELFEKDYDIVGALFAESRALNGKVDLREVRSKLPYRLKDKSKKQLQAMYRKHLNEARQGILAKSELVLQEIYNDVDNIYAECYRRYLTCQEKDKPIYALTLTKILEQKMKLLGLDNTTIVNTNINIGTNNSLISELDKVLGADQAIDAEFSMVDKANSKANRTKLNIQKDLNISNLTTS